MSPTVAIEYLPHPKDMEPEPVCLDRSADERCRQPVTWFAYDSESFVDLRVQAIKSMKK
jgi:hypothetical protein